MITNLKELERLLKLCRKQGVTEINLGTVSFKLGDLPQEKVQVSQEIETDSPYASFPDGELSPEQLMFYSAGGHPDDDPENKDIQ